MSHWIYFCPKRVNEMIKRHMSNIKSDYVNALKILLEFIVEVVLQIPFVKITTTNIKSIKYLMFNLVEIFTHIFMPF